MGKSDAQRRSASARPPALGAAAPGTFELDAAHWERLTELIDRPAQQKPGLKKLFARPSIFRRI
jgi:uncharacterized protein (DUF1778 family)